MTAGSGRRLCRSLLPSDPLGPFSRILLESETWASPEFYLTWDVKATRQGCLVWELAPSAPRTGECDTGLFADAWPTTRSRDYKDTGDGEWTMERKDGKSRTDQLGHALKSGWPTPRSEDSESAGAHRGTPYTLISAARTAWATPKKAESGPDFAIANREDSGGTSLPTQIAGPTTSGCLARTEKFVVRLTTLSAWLMGYTAQYLAPWATASCRKSPRRSSAP